MVENTFKLGDIVLVKVGKNLIEAELVEIMPDGRFKVKSLNTSREFSVRNINQVVASAAENALADESEEPAPAVEPQENSVADQQAVAPAPEPSVEDNEAVINPAHESDRPRRRMSLMSAAVEVLKKSNVPMNTREIVAAVIAQGLWEQTDCKTPEQSLYGSIFREIAAKDHPRIVRAEQRGKFRIAE